MRIQTKTTILFTVLTVAVFLVLTASVYFFLNEFAFNDFNKRLELRARIFARFNFEKDSLSTRSFQEIQQEYMERLEDEKSELVKLNASGVPEARLPGGLPLSYIEQVKEAGGATVYFQQKKVHYAGLLYKTETGDYVVLASATNKYGDEIMQQFGSILLITFLVAIGIIYGAGLYFSKKAFQPFRNITARVQQISEGNIQLRLREQDGKDEIAELVRTFNKMLDRMEAAFETQNNFISNASHELRTPLTAIVAEADYALVKERTAEVYQQSLKQILAQADRLQHLTSGLLSLAQSSFDGSKQRWEKIRMDQLIFDVRESVTEVLQESNIVIQLREMPEDEDRIAVYGNHALLKVALGNIIMNGCKYSNNAKVIIDLSVQYKKVVIKVVDKGIGIPQKDLRYIYNPFFRASNAKGFAGYGIGMPLSKNIIRLHGGEIQVHSVLGEGTEVTIALPAG